MKEFSDEQLTRMVADKDDRHAFAELVERYKSGVFALVLRVMGKSTEVEDVAQNVFIAVYRGLRTFEHKSKFSTWLYRITYNQACSAIRKMKTKIQQMTVNMMENEDGSLVEFEDAERQSLDDEVLKHQVWKAVDKLPALSRTVIELYHGQEVSYNEIAEILNIPIGTVKTHLHRARTKLRELLLA